MMTPWVDPFLFASACLGGGGLLLSLYVGMMPRSRTLLAFGVHVLFAVLALAAGGVAILAAMSDQSVAFWGSAGLLAGLYLLLVVVPAGATARSAEAVRHWTQGRMGRLTGMVGLWAFCPFLALALVYAQLEPPRVLTDAELAAMVLDEQTGPPEVNPNVTLTTDRGNGIATLVSRDGEPGETPERLARQARLLARCQLQSDAIYLPHGWQPCNCHGYVFGGGRHSIPGREVDTILRDNDYTLVSQVQPGDVAVYRDPAGQVSHTGIVRGQAGDGVILVESKWGMSGRFIHRHDRHPYANTTCAFYRSPRAGHLLHGIASDSAKDIVAAH